MLRWPEFPLLPGGEGQGEEGGPNFSRRCQRLTSTPTSPGSLVLTTLSSLWDARVRRPGFALLVLSVLVVAAPALADETPVDVELVLAVDVSASIDGGEIDLQRAGYVAALTDPRAISAMLSGPLGRVAVTYVEWSETAQVTVPWTVIASATDAQRFALAVQAFPVPRGGLTSIVNALDFSALLFEGNEIEGTRRVIDLSADGRDSKGDEPIVAAARDRALSLGIVINGLVINPQQEQSEVEGVKYDLEGYFHEVVIGGPGAFTVVTETPEDFPRAIVNKLVLEVSSVARPTRQTAAR